MKRQNSNIWKNIICSHHNKYSCKAQERYRFFNQNDSVISDRSFSATEILGIKSWSFTFGHPRAPQETQYPLKFWGLSDAQLQALHAPWPGLTAVLPSFPAALIRDSDSPWDNASTPSPTYRNINSAEAIFLASYFVGNWDVLWLKSH